MQWRFRFFIVMVWAGMITSIVSDIGDLVAFYFGLKTNFAYLNLLFSVLQIIVLYSIVKRKALFYYTGLGILALVFFASGIIIASLYVEVLQENYTYMIYGIGALSTLFALWIGYKMFLLFYKLSEQKLFLYAFPFYAIGTLLSFMGGAVDLVDGFNGGNGSEQYWMPPTLIVDIIVVSLSGIAFLRTKLETLQKNS